MDISNDDASSVAEGACIAKELSLWISGCHPKGEQGGHLRDSSSSDPSKGDTPDLGKFRKDTRAVYVFVIHMSLAVQFRASWTSDSVSCACKLIFWFSLKRHTYVNHRAKHLKCSKIYVIIF